MSRGERRVVLVVCSVFISCWSAPLDKNVRIPAELCPLCQSPPHELYFHNLLCHFFLFPPPSCLPLSIFLSFTLLCIAVFQRLQSRFPCANAVCLSQLGCLSVFFSPPAFFFFFSSTLDLWLPFWLAARLFLFLSFSVHFPVCLFLPLSTSLSAAKPLKHKCAKVFSYRWILKNAAAHTIVSHAYYSLLMRPSSFCRCALSASITP